MMFVEFRRVDFTRRGIYVTLRVWLAEGQPSVTQVEIPWEYVDASDVWRRLHQWHSDAQIEEELEEPLW